MERKSKVKYKSECCNYYYTFYKDNKVNEIKYFCKKCLKRCNLKRRFTNIVRVLQRDRVHNPTWKLKLKDVNAINRLLNRKPNNVTFALLTNDKSIIEAYKKLINKI